MPARLAKPVLQTAIANVGFVVLVFVGCTPEGQTCLPGDYVTCPCESIGRGYAQCSANGDGYGACDCSGKSPAAPYPAVVLDAGNNPDGGGSGLDGGADAGALSPLFSGCTKDTDCASGLCFPYNAKGPRCSLRCKTAADCPAPAPGCNNQGVCKLP